MLVNRKAEEDFVKVLDFGISKDLDLAVGDRHAALTRPNVAIGTPAYMSPEQAAGKPSDALTDVYAVGGLLYEMLAGRAPCEGEDAMDVLRKKATEDPPPMGSLRPGLPRDIERMVMRALARMPRDRHPSMAAFKEAVLACLARSAADSVTPTPPPLLHPTEMRPTSTARVRRGRIARGAVAATLAGATLAAVGLYLYFDRAGGAPSSAAVSVGPSRRTRRPPHISAEAAPEPAPAPEAAPPVETTPWPEPAAAAAPPPCRGREQACRGPRRRDGAGGRPRGARAAPADGRARRRARGEGDGGAGRAAARSRGARDRARAGRLRSRGLPRGGPPRPRSDRGGRRARADGC